MDTGQVYAGILFFGQLCKSWQSSFNHFPPIPTKAASQDTRRSTILGYFFMNPILEEC